MKPPRWKRGHTEETCPECLFVGQHKHFDVWVCAFIHDIYVVTPDRVLNTVSVMRPSAAKIAIQTLARPYIKDQKFTTLFYATLKLRS